MSSRPLLLRLLYSVVPERVVNSILPQTSSFPRQVVVVGSGSFLIGAAMEMFMIKTGFYDVATRKEAERQAMRRWEMEEAARLRGESNRGESN